MEIAAEMHYHGSLDADALFGPLVVGVPEETATYLELSDPEDTDPYRILLRAKFYELSGYNDLALAACEKILASGRGGEIEGGTWFCKGMLLAESTNSGTQREEMFHCFRKALECAIPSSLRSRIHMQVAMFHMYSFDDPLAGLTSMRDALAEPEAPSYIKGIAFQHLAAAAQEQEDYAASVSAYGDALKEQLSQNARASILSNLGRIYYNVYGDADAAYCYWRQAAPLFSRDKIDYDKEDEQKCIQGLAGERS